MCAGDAALVALWLLGALADGARSRSRPEPEDFPGLAADLVWHALALVPGPSFVALSPGGEMAELWSVGGRAARRLAALAVDGEAMDVAFFPTWDRIVTESVEGEVMAHNTSSGRSWQIQVGAQILAMRPFPDGETLATLDTLCRLIVWNTSSAGVLMQVTIPDGAEHTVARLFPDGDRLVTGVTGEPREPAIIWSVSGGRALHVLEQRAPPLDDAIISLEVSPCGTKVATAGFSRIFLWNASSGTLERALRRPMRSMRSTHWIAGLALSEGAELVVSYHNRDAELFLWDGRGGHLRKTLWADAYIDGVVLLGDGRHLAVFTSAGHTIYHVPAGEPLVALSGSTTGRAQRIVGRGGIVAACGGPVVQRNGWTWETAWARAWEVSTGRVLLEVDSPHSLLANDGELISSCSIAVGPTAPITDWLVD